ncbi:hypothetical protein AVEN_221439-1, partial [Araneus ventricosus]
MTRTARSLKAFAPHQREDVPPPTYDLTCNRLNTGRNRVSYLEPSDPESQTLPLGHRSLDGSLK